MQAYRKAPTQGHYSTEIQIFANDNCRGKREFVHQVRQWHLSKVARGWGLLERFSD